MRSVNVLTSSPSKGMANPGVIMAGARPPSDSHEDMLADVTPEPGNWPTSILIGVDDRGRPHASCFDAADHHALHAAADAMGFKVMP